jgi:sigma-B regulation protein RsbU (phosphoserine phosphatase)
MTPEVPPLQTVPDPVHQTLKDLEKNFALRFLVRSRDGSGAVETLYASPDFQEGEVGAEVACPLSFREDPPLELVIRGLREDQVDHLPGLVTSFLERAFEFSQEVRFFTYELSERYEEINLLYSISETLGSLIRLDEAARLILGEVCEVLGARRGSLWVFEPETETLDQVACVGEEGVRGPLSVRDPDAVTAQVFREGRPLILGRPGWTGEGHAPRKGGGDSILSVPIRYTPPSGEARTVGVINLIGQKEEGRFTASDQKLLSAIASQVGSALENHRLVRESLAQERVAREMELAHHLQMRLLPDVRAFEGAEVAARVQPAEQVGGDFFHLFHLSEGRIGVMIGDVSTHGFPAALIMALSMSAATIYAMEGDSPSAVLRHLDDALSDELESTEMYLSLFYGVLDPRTGQLAFSNAGHPHAFLIRGDGSSERLSATDPPMGIAGPDAYGQREIAWRPGEDLLLLFTDGISDTLNEVEDEGGEELVVNTAILGRKGDPQEVVDHLFRRAAEADPTIPADDRTVLILKA